MLANEIRFSTTFANQLKQLSPQLTKIILSRIKKLTYPPFKAIKLLGQLAPYRKLVIGDYRIIFRSDSKLHRILILVLEHQIGNFH